MLDFLEREEMEIVNEVTQDSTSIENTQINTANNGSKPKGRSIGWVFTLHDYSEQDEIILKSYESLFLIYGKEVSINGKPHLQGYIYFREPGKTFFALHKLLPTAHWEMSKGNIDHNIDYCSKMGSFHHQGTLL